MAETKVKEALTYVINQGCLWSWDQNSHNCWAASQGTFTLKWPVSKLNSCAAVFLVLWMCHKPKWILSVRCIFVCFISFPLISDQVSIKNMQEQTSNKVKSPFNFKKLMIAAYPVILWEVTTVQECSINSYPAFYVQQMSRAVSISQPQHRLGSCFD